MGLLVRALCLVAFIGITEANREGTGLHDYYAQLTDQKPDTENCDRWSMRVTSTRVTTFVRVTSVVLIDPSQNATVDSLKDCIKLCDSRVCTAFIFYIEELECETSSSFSDAGTPIRTGERDVEADSLIGFYVANEAFPVQPKCYGLTAEYTKFLEEFVNPWLYPARSLPTSPANHTTTAERLSTDKVSTSTSTSPESTTKGNEVTTASTTTTTERATEKATTSHGITLASSTTAPTSSQTATASPSTVHSTSWSSDALWETLYTTSTTLTTPGEEEKTLPSSATTASSSTMTSSGQSTAASSSTTVASEKIEGSTSLRSTETSTSTSTRGATNPTASQISSTPSTTKDGSTSSSRSTASTASSSTERATTSTSSSRATTETTSSSRPTTTTRSTEESTTTTRFDCVVNITGWNQIRLRNGDVATKEINTGALTEDLNGTNTGETIKNSSEINTRSDSLLNDSQYDWNITFSSMLPGCWLNISMENGTLEFRGPFDNETVTDNKDSLIKNLSVQCLCDRSSTESTESAESTPTSSSTTVTTEPTSSSPRPTTTSDASDAATTTTVATGFDCQIIVNTWTYDMKNNEREEFEFNVLGVGSGKYFPWLTESTLMPGCRLNASTFAGYMDALSGKVSRGPSPSGSITTNSTEIKTMKAVECFCDAVATDPIVEPTTVSSTDSTTIESTPTPTTTNKGDCNDPQLCYAGQVIIDEIPYLVPVNGVFSGIYSNELPQFKDLTSSEVEVLVYPGCSFNMTMISAGGGDMIKGGEINVTYDNFDGTGNKNENVNFADNGGYSGFVNAYGSCQMNKVGKTGAGYQN